MFIKYVFALLLITHFIICLPINDKALFDDEGPEERGRRRKRPCRGRSTDPEGRTFLDWSFQYLDVNYNYNYNINCGGGGGGNKPGLGGGGNKPSGGHHHGGGGLLSGLNQGGGIFPGNRPGGQIGGNKPPSPPQHGGNGGLLSVVQSQTQNLLGDGGIFGPQGISSWLPQGGISSWLPFNGQGILSLFDGGLFGNIFNNNNNRPPSNIPIQRPPQNPAPVHEITTQPPSPGSTDDPDMIYNDDSNRPVHEDHDPVADVYSNVRPAYFYPNRHREYARGRSNSNSNSNRIRFV